MIKRVYFDLDNTLGDYNKAHRAQSVVFKSYPQAEPGFYDHVDPIAGGIAAYKFLELMGFECRVLTAPSPFNPETYKGKATWVERHLGRNALANMIICNDKSLLKGHFLLDDNVTTNGQDKFEGRFIHCPYEEVDWKWVIASVTGFKILGVT